MRLEIPVYISKVFFFVVTFSFKHTHAHTIGFSFLTRSVGFSVLPVIVFGERRVSRTSISWHTGLHGGCCRTGRESGIHCSLAHAHTHMHTHTYTHTDNFLFFLNRPLGSLPLSLSHTHLFFISFLCSFFLLSWSSLLSLSPSLSLHLSPSPPPPPLLPPSTSPRLPMLHSLPS